MLRPKRRFRTTPRHRRWRWPDRIRVNAIAPGSIEFDDGLWDRRRVEDPALYHGTLAKIPFGRFGHRAIADAALFLCCRWRWVTGRAQCGCRPGVDGLIPALR